MKRIEQLSESIVNLSKSTQDSNRFYSILLDARSTTVSENTYDVAERLLRGETDNAKAALEHLWTLKKTMQNPNELSTIDMLIQYYQKKMDVVRTKEELIKKISRDSRTLLEDKRKRDTEIATIKQEISDCTTEINKLQDKLDKLTIKEQELTLIDTQLKKELLVNENEIINGLYEIILSQQEGDNPIEAFTEKLQEQHGNSEKPRGVDIESLMHGDKNDDTDMFSQNKPEKLLSIDHGVAESGIDVEKDKTAIMQLEAIIHQEDAPSAELLTTYAAQGDLKPAPFPKSVVKTTKGRVIGEYYYNPKAYKNKRHYIFNSQFFLQQISSGLATLSHSFDAALHTELLQMIQDVSKRIVENKMMHYEIATNEIVNDEQLKNLWLVMKSRDLLEAGRFCKRLHAKIEALKSNYQAMLTEQMSRYAE
jgi:hypothetical protein